ncbi:MAG: XrtA system polysaccharide chain length determinant, partial [Desulfovibrionales bacterium]
MAHESEFDYRKYLNLVLARKKLFAFVALTVMTGAVLVSYALPKVYEAESTVFIEENVIGDLVQGIAITPSMEAKIRVISESMLSRNLLQQVIQDLDMDLQYQDPSRQESFIDRLQKKTEISLDQKKGLFTIVYQDQDPKLARDFVNTLVQRYIEQNTSSKREESYAANVFLGQQIDVFKDRIDTIEDEISAYKSEKGMILATDEGFLRSEIADMEKMIEDILLRRNELVATRNILEQVDPLQARLQALQSQLDGLLVSYADGYPEVRRTRAEIAALQDRIQNRGPSSVKVISDPERYEQIQVELQALDRRQAKLQNDIQEKRQLLRSIPAAMATLRDMTENLNNQKVIYEQLVSRYGQSEVSNQMEIQNKASTFRIIDAAILPKSPVSPDRVSLILMGIIGGIGAAFGLLVLLDSFNQSVKSVDQIKELGLPVMAIIPKIRDAFELQQKRKSDMRTYAISGAYFSLILAVLVTEFLGLRFIDGFMENLDLQQHLASIKDSVSSLTQ